MLHLLSIAKKQVFYAVDSKIQELHYTYHFSTLTTQIQQHQNDPQRTMSFSTSKLERKRDYVFLILSGPGLFPELLCLANGTPSCFLRRTAWQAVKVTLQGIRTQSTRSISARAASEMAPFPKDFPGFMELPMQANKRSYRL